MCITTAYIIAGPVSSGNRLLASILIQSGCYGSSTAQQIDRTNEIPVPKQPLVLIKHTSIAHWVRALQETGYGNVVIIVLIREPIANVDSMIRNEHYQNTKKQRLLDRRVCPIDINRHAHKKDLHRIRTSTIAENIAEARDVDAELEIISYEGLSEQFLRRWLPLIGLEYVESSDDICNQNDKYYEH